VPSDPELILECLRAATGEADTRLTAMDVRKFAALLRAYGHYAYRLAALALLDRADVFRAAAANAARCAGPLCVYGFYDMIQVQADLVAELSRHGALTLFVPYGADPDTWRFGEWFRTTFARSVTTETESLRCPAPALLPEIHSAGGERDEVWFSAKAIRRLLDDGCFPDDIAVCARRLDPYLRHIEELFQEHRIAHSAGTSLPLLDHPLAQAIRLLFRVELDDFPRAAVLDVVCHPLFRDPSDRRHWNLLARALRINRGADWLRLDRYAQTGYRLVAGRQHGSGRRAVQIPAGEVRALREAAGKLLAPVWPAMASWRQHAEAHRAAMEQTFLLDALLEDEAAVVDIIRDVLDTLGGLDRFGGTVSRQSFIDAFEHECRRRRLERAAGRGVAVLDAMGIRGLSFRHVFLLGMNARVFPRFIVEEPFVSDAVRREVFRVLGHHLAVRMDGYAEERLLFHLVRAAASEQLVCLYQRADTRGRLRDPSPFLRPFLPLEHQEVDAVPRSPRAKSARECPQTPREQILAARDVQRAMAAFG
jgi:ATP-dependent helicase/nuclease subunit B